MTDLQVRPPAVDAAASTGTAAGGTRPGSAGEHQLQDAHGTAARATRFYANQLRDHLLPTMVDFVGRMQMIFVATSAPGHCDSTLRAGTPGFLHVLDPHRLAYPEHRAREGDASLANIGENPHVGLLMVDFEDARIGLHVNGSARVVDDTTLRAEHPELPPHPAPGQDEVWVLVDVEEAYIHCRKHIPRMATLHRNA